MKSCSKCGIEKNLDQFYADKAFSDGKRKSCRECEIKRRIEFRKNNVENERLAARKRYDPIKAKLAANLFKDRHPGKFVEYARNYRNKNRRRVRLRGRTFNNLRRSRVRKATPKWLTEDQKQQILLFYEKARILTLKTGVKHEVDHVHPINGVNVCGLHVPWNLQVITKAANVSKGNRL